MNRFIKQLAIGFFCIAIPITSWSAAWIDGLEGSVGDFKLSRNGQLVAVKIFLMLEEGDCIDVVHSGSTLWIASDNPSIPRKAVSYENPPYCLKSEDIGRARGLGSNLVAWIGGWLTDRVTTQARAVVSTVARGEEMQYISLPLASLGGLKMVAGRRPMYLAWEGGCPPYSVRVVTEDGHGVLMHQQGIQESRFTSAPMFFRPGRYRIEIGDKDENVKQALEVVESGAMPSPPSELQATKGSDDMQALLKAAALASHGSGWAFEAYQIASELGDHYQPARVLRESIEQGDMPPRMPQ